MHCLSAYFCVREITSLDNQIDLKNICNVFYTTKFLSSWALCVPRNRWLIKQDWKFRPCREMYRYLDQLIFYIFFWKVWFVCQCGTRSTCVRSFTTKNSTYFVSLNTSLLNWKIYIGELKSFLQSQSKSILHWQLVLVLNV